MSFYSKIGIFVGNFPDHHVLVQTVQECEAKYTKRQVADAQEARALSKNLGFPSDADLAKLISSGALLNSKVTAQDVRRTQDIYGPDPAVLKGKTKHVTPGVVKLDTPEPPSEPQQSLHSEPYLISVSVPLGLVFVKFLAGRTAGVLCNALT